MTGLVTGGRLALGDLDVELVVTTRGAELAWQAHGTLKLAPTNALLVPYFVTTRA